MLRWLRWHQAREVVWLGVVKSDGRPWYVRLGRWVALLVIYVVGVILVLFLALCACIMLAFILTGGYV